MLNEISCIKQKFAQNPKIMAKAIPVMRIYDYAKALEFYKDWLGFNVDWEHQPEGIPVYMQISREGIVLHLSEHHGDGTPGTNVYVEGIDNLRAYNKQLLDKEYKYMRPGIEPAFWNENILCMTVIDPFGNRIIFTGDK